ncbi:MAG: hypothetical protein WB817_18495, partial [Terriglobales bacterium]
MGFLGVWLLGEEVSALDLSPNFAYNSAWVLRIEGLHWPQAQHSEWRWGFHSRFHKEKTMTRTIRILCVALLTIV